MNGKWVACYVRVSTADQEKGRLSQEKAIRDYCRNHGMQNIKFYRDTLSGSTVHRPAFEKMQKRIFNGNVDTVVTWKLDRLSRSLKDGICVLTDWLAKDIRIVAVAQQLDFSGPVGKMVAGILFAVAEMERENLRENTKRGMAGAKARGKKLGRPPKLDRKRIAKLLLDGMSVSDIAAEIGCSRQFVYNIKNGR
jgi:DNA invertase Pin-like site-specific DNA recombinase